MLVTGDYLVNFGVPLSIILSLFLGCLCRSKISKYILLMGGMLFLLAYLLVLVFGYSCDGHPFIGYGNCSLFSKAVAGFASQIAAFAVSSYLLSAGPVFVFALLTELFFRVIRRRRTAGPSRGRFCHSS